MIKTGDKSDQDHYQRRGYCIYTIADQTGIFDLEVIQGRPCIEDWEFCYLARVAESAELAATSQVLSKLKSSLLAVKSDVNMIRLVDAARELALRHPSLIDELMSDDIFMLLNAKLKFKDAQVWRAIVQLFQPCTLSNSTQLIKKLLDAKYFDLTHRYLYMPDDTNLALLLLWGLSNILTSSEAAS
jgi:hypothetical protein